MDAVDREHIRQKVDDAYFNRLSALDIKKQEEEEQKQLNFLNGWDTGYTEHQATCVVLLQSEALPGLTIWEIRAS